MGGVFLEPLDGDLTYTAVAVTTASSGDLAVVTGTAGTVIRVYAILLVPGGTTAVTFKNGGTAVSGALPFTATQIMGPLMMPFTGQPYYTLTAGNTFNINNSNAVQISGTVWFTQNAAPLA